ncbi:hypothetical protein ARMSODRAFT_1048629 [Armillaria solidipes]|uniref:HMG box domain-containing protein n=1 Tax=Armillaria solidipes TaxID=1076256 RepID=A0A2H3BAX7_9AGAR|nr:hypothetical protein ARMSODRAFT_1048629 [Armillaria solidipes]
MSHTLLLSDLALSDNSLQLFPPATRASSASTPVSSSTPTRPCRRPRNAFIIFRDVFLAVNKNILPRQQTEVSSIAGAIWRGLSGEQQLIYQTLARLEREAYERDDPAPALQRRVSAGANDSRNSRRRRVIPSQSVVDLLHGPVAQGMDAQAFLYRAPTIAPTATPEIPRVQYPSSFMMNGNTDAVFLDVHTTQGQGIIEVQHGQATQGLRTSHQGPASISVPTQATAITETSISDSQTPVSYYRDTSGQSFAIMNQTAIPQYLPSAPIVAPIARRPNPDPAFTHQQLAGNTYNHNNSWGGLSATHASASSSVEVGSSNHGGGSTHGGGSSAYYEHPAENTWDDSQYRQHQLWSSGYSGQPS